MSAKFSLDSRFRGDHPRMARAESPTVKVADIAWLVFERPDMESMENFLTDFGLTVAHRDDAAVYLRGAEPWPACVIVRKGNQPDCISIAFRAKSPEDLRRLSSSVPGAGPVEARDGLGGGQRVLLKDPMGMEVEVIWGLDETNALPCRPPLVRNTPEERLRVGPVLPEDETPSVIRLGHAVFNTPCYEDCFEWYTRHLGMLPSDYFVGPDGGIKLAFLRCDHGDNPVDHHTFVLRRGNGRAFQHAAFEVADYDAIGWGQQILKAAGWTHLWGVGRHLIGANIFDYWCDPWGAAFEHFADSELLDATHEPGYHLGTPGNLYQWGPDISPAFLDPSYRHPGFLNRLLQRLGLRRNPAVGARPWLG